MKYLKKFSTHSDYETFTGSTDFIRPNVSVCVNEKEVHYNTSNIPIVHEYVDLGLPSGTLWATENIKDSNGNKLYFAWGETQGYTSEQVGTDKYFNWNIWSENYPVDYAFGAYDYEDETNYGMTKYNKIDNKAVLDTIDDAATVNWGPDWVMPTKEQFDELVANTTTAFTEETPGLVFTSVINNNTLFLPFDGTAIEGYAYNEGTEGQYWSSSRYVPACSVSYEMFIESGGYSVSNEDRCRGCTIRPVRASN